MSDIQARLRFDITQFQNALNQVRGEMRELRTTARSSGQGLGASMFGPLKGAIAGLGLAKLTSEVFDAVLRFDTLEKTLRVTEGSAEGAARRLEELRLVGQKPGLSLEAAVSGDVRLRAVGMSAAQSTRILLEMGNALSLVGGSQEDLAGVLLALTQISSKGKVFAEEINQINERLPQVRTVMKEVFGTSVSEDIQKLNLDANDFIMRLVDGFAQLERAQPGLREDLTELGTVFTILANDAFSPLIHEIIPAFRELTTLIAENKTGISSFGKTAASALKELVHLGEFIIDVGKYAIDPAAGLNQKNQPGPEAAATQDKDPFSGLVKPPKAGAASGSGAGSAGAGGGKKPDAWKDAEKLLKLQEQIAAEKKKMAEDGLSVQDKVLAKQKEVDEALQLESLTANDGSAENKLALELKRLQLQHELNRLLDEQSRAIHQAAEEIDREVAAERKLAVEAAKATSEKKKQRDAGRNEAMMSLEVLRLRARGRDKQADKVEREDGIRSRQAELRALGASEESAARQAREEQDRRDQIERRKNGQRGHIYGRRGPGQKMGSAGGGGLDEFKRQQNDAYSNDLEHRGQRVHRFGSDGGSLSDRAVRAAGAQDARGTKDTTGPDVANKIIAILTQGLLG